MQITPVTALPGNGVTTGALTPTASRTRLEIYSGSGTGDYRVIRMLESGTWLVAADVAPQTLRAKSRVIIDFPSNDANEKLHVLSNGTVPSDAVIYMKSIAPSGNVLTITETKHVRVTTPAAPGTTAIVAQADIANGVATIAAQPTWPCKVQFKMTDANSSVTAGTATIVYTDVWGVTRTEVWNLANQGTKTFKTTWAVAKVTSITIAGLVGNLAGTDKMEAGPTAELGLPAPKSPTPTNFVVIKENLNGADEAVGTVDAAAGTISPTTAPDGARNFDIFYQYQIAISA